MSQRRFNQEKILRDLAYKHGLSVDEVKQIVESPFKLFINDIKEDRPIDRRIPYLGSFKAKEKSWKREKK